MESDSGQLSSAWIEGREAGRQKTNQYLGQQSGVDRRTREGGQVTRTGEILQKQT